MENCLNEKGNIMNISSIDDLIAVLIDENSILIKTVNESANSKENGNFIANNRQLGKTNNKEFFNCSLVKYCKSNSMRNWKHKYNNWIAVIWRDFQNRINIDSSWFARTRMRMAKWFKNCNHKRIYCQWKSIKIYVSARIV